MLENFPKLNVDQVVLSRADINTGIVLDERLSYALDSTQKIYTIFNNVEEALKFAMEIIREKKEIECYIHGSNKRLLYKLDYKDIK